ncbi:pseudouridine synthase [Zavarzinia sp. CC-PAN008]|uniref:pseudouridine synthase n=1 Tax=Zavarzinia sp. CC-PAN008 TaxID=3243332 RepID=UPI003F7475B9
MSSSDTGGERIAKVIARSGLCSRRDAERMIEEGRVELDGVRLTAPNVNVGPTSRIKVDGKALPIPQPARLWRYHKPRGLVTSHKDEGGRPTVFGNLPPGLPRVVSIGRLDLNSEGLLLLTNDGGLKRRLELPSTAWVRRYRVRVMGEVDRAALARLRHGIVVDGIAYGPIEAELDREGQGRNAWLTMSLTEGKNREIRRVLEHLGLSVNRLIRVSYGPFELEDLEAGQVRSIAMRDLAEALGERPSATGDEPVRKPRGKARPVLGKGPRPQAEPGAEEAAAKPARTRKPAAPRGRPVETFAGSGRRSDRPPAAPKAERGPRPAVRAAEGSGRPARSRPAGEGSLAAERPPARAAGRPAGGRPAEARPAGARPHGARPAGPRPSTPKPSGTRPSATRPSGARPSGARPAGAKPSGSPRPSGGRPKGPRK